MIIFLNNKYSIHIIPIFSNKTSIYKETIFINMKIIVSENQFEKIMVTEGLSPDVLIEQIAVANDQNSLIVIQQKINQLLSDPKKEKALLDGINIQLHRTPETFVLQIGQKKFPMKKMVQGIYAVIIPAGEGFSAATIPLASFAAEIEKIPEYKAMVEKHPEIQSQIQAGKAFSQLYADKVHQGYFKLTIVTELEDRKEEKLAVDVKQPYPLGEFFANNKVIFRLTPEFYGILESGSLMADIVAPRISVNPPKQQAMTAPVNVETMALADVFEFGGVNFKDEARTNQRIQEFVQQMKGYVDMYGTPFIEHIKRQNPTVYGYASMDGDPNQKIQGNYQPCAANGTRAEYDMCLSTERAKAIAEILNQSLPEMDGAFQSKGMGETTKWGPGWTAENPTIPEQTAPNRRYLLSKLQPFVVQGKPIQTPNP